MGCVSCNKTEKNIRLNLHSLNNPPFRASDIVVFELDSLAPRFYENSDWDNTVDNVLLFVNDISLISESGELTDNSNANIIYVTNQSAEDIKSYLESAGPFELNNNKIFISYLLPSRLNLINNGIIQKAIVYIMGNGEVSVNQLFHNSSFNYNLIEEYINEYHDNN